MLLEFQSMMEVAVRKTAVSYSWMPADLAERNGCKNVYHPAVALGRARRGTWAGSRLLLMRRITPKMFLYYHSV